MLKSSGLIPIFSENMPSGIVAKSPKPGFGPFGGIDVGVVWSFCTQATVYSLFDLGRHLVSANYYRDLRVSAITEWETGVARSG